MNEVTTTVIGCDLGDRKSDVCVMQGENRQFTQIPSTRRGFEGYFRSRPACRVVIEVGQHSRWVSEQLQELGHEVIVANARQVQLISKSLKKSDRRDAELLARLGRADVKLLAPIQHRGAKAQADLATPKARDVLVKTRTRLINHVRGTVKSFGSRMPGCNAKYFHRKTRSLVPEELQAALDPIYSMLEKLAEQIKQYEDRIQQIADTYPEVKRLSQPKGVGPITALTYVLTLEDPKRFKRRDAAAFLGIVPRRSQSGGHDPQLRITKAGDPFVRRMLVQSAQYTLGPFGEPSDLRDWGLALANRGGKNAKKRAIVAVARKLAVLLHALWTTEEPYVPVGYREHRRVAA